MKIQGKLLSTTSKASEYEVKNLNLIEIGFFFFYIDLIFQKNKTEEKVFL